MMGLATMKAMNNERAREARNIGLQPLVYNGNPDTLRSMPNFGDYRATKYGWRMTDEYFVDSSGFGSESEPALTFSQFVGKAKVGKGYAIIEEGQFQVRIGEFSRIKTNKSTNWRMNQNTIDFFAGRKI